MEVAVINIVTSEDLRQLVEMGSGGCVSIYQPAHRAGPDTRTHAQEDPLRLKNLLRAAEERLTANGLRARETPDTFLRVKRHVAAAEGAAAPDRERG
jgi:hypothetical protein